jgi:hypothetical protein
MESIEISQGHTGPDNPEAVEELNEQETPLQGQEEQPTQEGYEVPDKFMREDGSVDVEALSQSYMELEKGGPVDAEEPTETDSAFPLSEEEMAGYADELFTTGDISETSYEAMVAQGLPRELVERYVAGQKALVQTTQSSLLEGVGGQAAYDTVTEWAGDNLSESEILTYDTLMKGGDPAQIQMAIQGLHARFQQANGTPTLLSGHTGSQGTSNGFRSWSEVTEAMRDPKYRTDPAYRQDIENRLSTSNL